MYTLARKSLFSIMSQNLEYSVRMIWPSSTQTHLAIMNTFVDSKLSAPFFTKLSVSGLLINAIM